MTSEEYWQAVRKRAKELHSDGCSHAKDWYLDCCLQHDIAYRQGCSVDGTPMTRTHADAQFRHCIQQRSPLGRCSPMSWVRWTGVRLFGWVGWRRHRRKETS